MAALNSTMARLQFEAVAAARWAMLRHSLKTVQGKLELFTRVLTLVSYSGFGLLFGVGAAFLAYLAARHDAIEMIAAILWVLTAFWQLFPILKSGFTNTFDPNTLLRFPLTYRTYFFLRLFYGALEPVALVALLGLVGITVGVTAASPALLPWCAMIALLFIALNILLTQLLLTWVERWLAQRRTREILGTLFFIAMIGLQLIGPITERMGVSDQRRGEPRISRAMADRVVSLERLLPPGLAGHALNAAQKGEYPRSAIDIGGLGLYGFFMTLLLDARLKKQYRGENLSESMAPKRVASGALRMGWALPGFSAPVAAMVEKEIRYLIRSGPMLLSFVMPLVMLFIFGGRSRGLPPQMATMTFPLAAGYSLLILTNVLYNNFGGDHAGVQMYYMSPTPLRTVIAAKNLVHTGIFLIELALLWVAACLMRGAPPLWVTVATLSAVPFALGLEFSAGNLLSIYSPKKQQYQVMGRQRTPQLNALLALAVHALVVATAGAVFLAARRYGPGLAAPIFLAMDAGALALYAFSLRQADALAMSRRETMFEALCRE